MTLLANQEEKGTEYELEFEDEYDFGTIARVESWRGSLANFRSSPIWGDQSIDRVLDLSAARTEANLAIANLKSPSFRNRTRPRTRAHTRFRSDG
jgi:hypothetical protein